MKSILTFGLRGTAIVFGSASLLLIIETRFLIPWLREVSGWEPIILWFLVSGCGLFLPLIGFTIYVLHHEGIAFRREEIFARLRFCRMNRRDWALSIAAFLVIAALSFLIMKLLAWNTGAVATQPGFMTFEPLSAGRYWILLIWFPYWIVNILGEEIIWRGVILPRQEEQFGKIAWLVNGVFWGVFHIAFGFHLLITLIPILLIQPYVAQRTRNSWPGVFIHAALNGPSFLAIAFGVL